MVRLCGSSLCSTACDFAISSSGSVTFKQMSVAGAVLLRDENCCPPESSSSRVPPSPVSSSSSPSSGSCFGGGWGIHQPEMRVSVSFLTTQKEQCRFLRCTECCFCGNQFSEVPVQQEPDPDSNGSEAEQQKRDNNAGWDEGACRQCGACYLRSSVRPALCPCGAECCGCSLRCLVAHTKSCAAQTTPGRL